MRGLDSEKKYSYYTMKSGSWMCMELGKRRPGFNACPLSTALTRLTESETPTLQNRNELTLL
jgi:hypothetical protein